MVQACSKCAGCDPRRPEAPDCCRTDNLRTPQLTDTNQRSLRISEKAGVNTVKHESGEMWQELKLERYQPEFMMQFQSTGIKPITARSRGAAGGTPGHGCRDVAGPGLEALPPVPVRRPVRIQVVAVHAREAYRVAEVILFPQLHLGRFLAVPCAPAAARPHRSGAAAAPAPLGSQLSCASVAGLIAPRRGHVEMRLTKDFPSVRRLLSAAGVGRGTRRGSGLTVHADPPLQPEHSLAEIRPTDTLCPPSRRR